MHTKTVAALTLGCKVNQQETDSILALLYKAGYNKIAFDDKADVYLINTCTVTHLGDRKSRQMVRRAVNINPEAIVVVTGCYAQRDAEEILKIPGVNIVIGTKNRSVLPVLIEKIKSNEETKINAVSDIMAAKEFEEISSEEIQSGRVRAYLKIQEGCNQFCSYCIIPYTRGPVRSRSLENVLEEAQRLTEGGHKEIILTGIHTAAYGLDNPEGPDLGVLVRELVKLPKLYRLRISSIDPHEFGENLLETIISNPKVCPHFHIPLQSGSNSILQVMNRPYDLTFYRKLVNKLRTRIPKVAITTDVMVGFPGETDVDFQEGLKFIEEMAFSGIHIFKYSPRSGTPAATFPNQISPEKKEERSKELQSLAKLLWKNYAEEFIAQPIEVLIEQQNKQGFWEGHTPEYLRVVLKADNLSRGDIISAEVTAVKDGYLESTRR